MTVKCARPDCSNPARPGGVYCCDDCRRENSRSLHNANNYRYRRDKRQAARSAKHNHERVLICPPDVAKAFYVSRSEWDATKRLYPVGTIYVIDGQRLETEPQLI